MASVNKVIIVGNLGRDPETRYLPSGEAVTNISVATTETWKDKASGEKKEATEWHRISFFGKLAEIAGEYLKKGSQVYVEGQLRTRKYQDKETARTATAPRSAPTACRCSDRGRARASRAASRGGEAAPRGGAPAKPARRGEEAGRQVRRHGRRHSVLRAGRWRYNPANSGT